MLAALLECSRPFDRILVGDRQLFISCVGREVDAQEVARNIGGQR